MLFLFTVVRFVCVLICNLFCKAVSDMEDECPFCNERTLSWEDFGNFQGDCTGMRVCTSCGGVVDDNNLTADEGTCNSVRTGSDNYFQASAKERQQYNVRCGARSMPKGRRQGLDLTKRIAHYMDCKPSMTSEAVELFERLFAHPNFKSRRIVAKLAIAACSVYIICRQHQWPVMLADVSGMIDNNVQAVDSWRRRIVATFPDLADVRAPDLFELVEARCKKAALSNEVQQTAIAILKLSRDLWITDGRKQDNVVTPALFIAWQSEKPIYRLKAKLRRFSCDHQLPTVGDRTASCLANMKQTLCCLAEKIPWVTAGSVTDTNLALHVKDIVNYRSTLIAEARSEILRLQCADDDDVTHIASEHSDADIGCRSSASTQELHPDKADDGNFKHTAAVNTNAMTSKDLVVSHCMGTTFENESAVKNNRHSVKRQHADYYESFWPPPGYKPYKRKLTEESTDNVEHPNMDCVYLSSHDIPDEDMHLYLKSDAEEQ